MKIDIDMTIKFTNIENDVFLYADDASLIIEDGWTRDRILDLVFPEFKNFQGWDTTISVTNNIIIRTGERDKKGHVYLYSDGSIAYVVEDNGEITLRYIGNQYEMGYRIDNLKFVVPGVDNWFTTLLTAQPANI